VTMYGGTGSIIARGALLGNRGEWAGRSELRNGSGVDRAWRASPRYMRGPMHGTMVGQVVG